MTTYTSIPNSSLEPGKPIRSIDGLALRDNPIAIAEGAVGAPQIQTAALVSGERMNTTNVLAATSGASVGVVGTYALMFNNINTTVAPGSTIAGSSLRYVGTSFSTASNSVANTTVPSGTWRVMGYFTATSGCGPTDGRITLCLRIS